MAKITGSISAPPAISGVATGPPSISGVTLPRGKQGPTSDLRYYTHYQTTPDEIWVVQHNLGRKANAQPVDSAGTVVIGEIQHIDDNLLLIKFTAGFSGTAIIGG